MIPPRKWAAKKKPNSFKKGYGKKRVKNPPTLKQKGTTNFPTLFTKTLLGKSLKSQPIGGENIGILSTIYSIEALSNSFISYELDIS